VNLVKRISPLAAAVLFASQSEAVFISASQNQSSSVVAITVGSQLDQHDIRTKYVAVDLTEPIGSTDGVLLRWQ